MKASFQRGERSCVAMFRSVRVGLEVIAQPAPRTQRPLANIPNPYPYGCSVLCNHPRDPELKDVVWKSRFTVMHFI